MNSLAPSSSSRSCAQIAPGMASPSPRRLILWPSIMKAAATVAASLITIVPAAAVPALVVSQPSPLSATVGQALPQVSFAVTELTAYGSWKLTGTLPPGVKLIAREKPSEELTGPGTLDATEAGAVDEYGYSYGPGNATTTPVLSGTPTQAGSFTITLQAFALAGLGGASSPAFNYTINITAASSGNVGPAFTRQPAAQTLTVGGTLVLTAAVSGTPAPALQWQRNGVAIPGATGATLTIPNAQLADAGSYTVVATNAGGTVTSVAAAVAINSGSPNAPVVARHPAGQVVAVGSTVVFSAEVTGASSYQWQKDGAALAGATGATLVLGNVASANAGSYAVVAANASGNVTSNAGALTVSDDPNFGHLINLSIRTQVSAGDPFFTIGTTVGGGSAGAAKPLLLRAVGPTLAGFGISTALADSKLDVFSGSVVVASNDNWDGANALTNIFAQVGAFPLASAGSKDAAVFNPNLAAGSYTVQVSGVGGASGEVLAELYDASASFSGATPRLVNVSVRKQIATNTSLTAGFVIGGTTARTVLVRAIGPALSAFGLTGFMADPQVALFSGQTKLAENDNWGGDPQLTSAGGGVGAFAIANASSRDAMILMTLSPGGYTVQVSGVGGSGGEALVEIYEVP